MTRWAEVFAELEDDDRVVVCGHTHMPFARLVDRRLVVNSGSIGMPYGRVGGSWALLRDGQVELRHTTIDVEAAVAAVVAARRTRTGRPGPTSTCARPTATRTPLRRSDRGTDVRRTGEPCPDPAEYEGQLS